MRENVHIAIDKKIYNFFINSKLGISILTFIISGAFIFVGYILTQAKKINNADKNYSLLKEKIIANEINDSIQASNDNKKFELVLNAFNKSVDSLSRNVETIQINQSILDAKFEYYKNDLTFIKQYIITNR
jgi:hypothetical protein